MIAALAAVIGLIDVVSEARIRELNDVWWHAGGNVLAVLIALYNFYTRYEQGSASGEDGENEPCLHRGSSFVWSAATADVGSSDCASDRPAQSTRIDEGTLPLPCPLRWMSRLSGLWAAPLTRGVRLIC